ncbi:hypothetical protein LCGC14_0538960 [marine sediment metagenome]|uniref:Uncharacterized protein n=1 Tax=marine sediment metagenome TaxID=412755 RepID=A0A0F9UES3_9ZZZZ|nr:hypothetical protein [Methylophaga sp.]HEC59176.1 hypothetical protein [Methylophaga sp.]
MNIWDMLSYAAWVAAGLFLLWIVVDAIKVSLTYDEDLLMSSREGLDELDPDQAQSHAVENSHAK